MRVWYRSRLSSSLSSILTRVTSAPLTRSYGAALTAVSATSKYSFPSTMVSPTTGMVSVARLARAGRRRRVTER